jgi:hypothetical protein
VAPREPRVLIWRLISSNGRDRQTTILHAGMPSPIGVERFAAGPGRGTKTEEAQQSALVSSPQVLIRDILSTFWWNAEGG